MAHISNKDKILILLEEYRSESSIFLHYNLKYKIFWFFGIDFLQIFNILS